MHKPRTSKITIGLWAVASLLGWLALTWAQTCPAPPGENWRHMAQTICEDMGVPSPLALAVVMQESNGHPYALRINAGQGYSLYPETWAEAVRIVQAITPITTNIDVGLMQVNWRIWGPKLGLSAAQLLDPQTNVAAGCHILRQALDTKGPAWQRIGRYHSGRRARQRRYAMRIARQMEKLMNTR